MSPFDQAYEEAPVEVPAEPEVSPEVQEFAEILSGYWANEQDESKLFSTLCAKESDFFGALERRGFFTIFRLGFNTYYGLSSSSLTSQGQWETQSLSFSGANGELLVFSVNEFRAYVDQILGMTVRNRPSFRIQATNTDYQSLIEVEASGSAVDYMYSTELGEAQEREFAKRELLYGKSFLEIDWDEDAGEDVQIPVTVESPMGPVEGPPETKKTGVMGFKVRFPWEVISEPYKSERKKHNWRTTIDLGNKWDQIAHFPAFAKRISELKEESFQYQNMFPGTDAEANDSGDNVVIRTFYHAKTPALPQGRKVVYVGDVRVSDKPLPLGVIPIAVHMSCEMHGTSFGVSDMWNLIPLSQMKSQVLSDMATNLESFGRPPFVIPEGTDIDIDALANGQKMLYLPASVDRKQLGPVEFPQFPAAAPKFVEMLRMFEQSLTGLNATARGEPSSNVTSGAMAAFFGQQAIEAQSPREDSLALTREQIGNIILEYLQKYATVPMWVAIAGKDEEANLKQMTLSDTLAGVKRVRVKTSDLAMRTQAGRMQIAEVLRQWPGQPLKDPQRIIELIVSGQFKPSYNQSRVSELQVKRENEALQKGPQVQTIPGQPGADKQIVPEVPVYAIDNHPQHIQGHIEGFYSTNDEAAREAYLAHILNHLDVGRNGDPFLASIIGNPNPQMAVAPELGAGAPGGEPSEKEQSGAQNAMKQPGEDDSTGAQMPNPAQPPGL